MAIEQIRDEGQELEPPLGKIVGIVDSRAEFENLAQALKASGLQAEALLGEEGVALLERIDRFFFSDMEERVLGRHIEELKAGHMIIIIKAPPERRDEAVRLATQNGARRLVHFGRLAVTWLTM